MAIRTTGPRTWRFRRDEDGHRYYEVDWRVWTDSIYQSPAKILANWPLPVVGYPYNLATWFPGFDGVDTWAFCTPELNIAPAKDVAEGEPHLQWDVTQYFSTKQSWRCNTFPIENPLLEPYELSGDFTHEQREATVDKDNKPLMHPNYQPITGPQVERKFSYPNIAITFNVATLPLSTFTLLMNKVNDAPLWGLPARTIRFSDARWERKVYGSCFYYFRISYVFEINRDTFDPKVPAEGTVALRENGRPGNPQDYVPVVNTQAGEYTSALLDSEGRAVRDPRYQFIQTLKIAEEGDLLLLGIPTTFS